MKIICFIDKRQLIHPILEHLNIWQERVSSGLPPPRQKPILITSDHFPILSADLHQRLGYLSQSGMFANFQQFGEEILPGQRCFSCSVCTLPMSLAGAASAMASSSTSTHILYLPFAYGFRLMPIPNSSIAIITLLLARHVEGLFLVN